jgi:hypothetical protein
MKMIFFQFNGKFYEQTEGAAMGKFVYGQLEMVLKQRNLLPKVWVRYVDNIFCVISRRKATMLLSLLNS